MNCFELDKYVCKKHNNACKLDELIIKASRLTGIKEKTALARLSLEALIARESSKRLAKLGRTEKKLQMIPRRRSVKD